MKSTGLETDVNVFFFTTASVSRLSDVGWYNDLTMMNWGGFGMKLTYLIDARSRYSVGRTEENKEKKMSQHRRCPGRYSNRPTPEYKSRISHYNESGVEEADIASCRPVSDLPQRMGNLKIPCIFTIL
jgi:hypothetical protein